MNRSRHHFQEALHYHYRVCHQEKWEEYINLSDGEDDFINTDDDEELVEHFGEVWHDANEDLEEVRRSVMSDLGGSFGHLELLQEDSSDEEWHDAVGNEEEQEPDDGVESDGSYHDYDNFEATSEDESGDQRSQESKERNSDDKIETNDSHSDSDSGNEDPEE